MASVVTPVPSVDGTVVGHRRTDPSLALAYLGPGLIAALVALGWFRSGRFIAAGDVSPFIRNSLATEAGSLWNHQVTGAGGTSADAGRAVEVLLIAGTRLLGGSELMAQRLLFVAVISFGAMGVVHAARLLVGRASAASVAGALAVFNPFVLLHLPNVIFPLAIGLIGVLVGELLAHLDGRPTTVVRLTLASLPVAYLSINPPLVVVAAGAGIAALSAASVLGDGAADTWRTVGRSLPLVALIHGFWLVPFAVVHGSGAEGVAFAAVTDVDSWSWVYAESSLDRVVTLTAHWGWPFSEYFPYNDSLDSVPWVVLRWILPAGAALGAAVAGRGRRLVALGLLATALLMVVLSQGLHAPFGPVNRMLYDHVPGWWLFRDPMSKFGPVIVVIYCVLFAVVIDRALAALSPGTGRLRMIGRSAVVVVTAAAIVHPHPLVTGEAVASDRGTLPSSHVAVPSDWLDVASAVSGSIVAGKVALLPLNDYYQVTTNWGYHGADAIPQLFDRPVLQRHPGGYFAELAGYDALLEATQSAIAASDGRAAHNLLDSLGTSHLVIRRDVAVERSGDDPSRVEALIDGAARIDGLELVAETDVAVLYERPSPGLVRAEPLLVATAPGSETAAVMSGPGAVVPPTVAADRIVWNDGAAPDLTFVSRSDPYRIDIGGTERLDLAFTVDGRRLRADLVDRVAIDGRTIGTDPVFTVETGRRPVDALLVGDSLVPYEEGVVVDLGRDETVTALTTAPAIRPDEPSPIRDCNNFDDRTMDELGFGLAPTRGGVVLAAVDHSACVVYDLGDDLGRVELSLSMASFSGLPARICLWSSAAERCVVEDRVAGGGWQARTYSAQAPGENGTLELFVYADGDGDQPTRAGYRDIVVRRLEPLGTGSFDEATTVGSVDLDAGEHRLGVARRAPNLLGSFGEVGDCNRNDGRSQAEAGLAAAVAGTTVTLSARAHAACVSAPVDVDPGDPVVVSFDYEVQAGLEARFCLWQSGVESCAPAPELDGSGRFRAELQTSPDSTELALYLYADGNDGGTTRIAYSNPAVTPAGGARVVLDRAPSKRTGAPSLTADQRTPSSFDVEVTGAGGPFVLVLAESHAPGWQLTGLPEGWEAEHVVVDAYANGWRIDGEGDAVLRLAYGPARLASAANKTSLLAFAGLAVVPVRRRARPTATTAAAILRRTRRRTPSGTRRRCRIPGSPCRTARVPWLRPGKRR